jgi:uncharacterized LabA/DUF88 family protein
MVKLAYNKAYDTAILVSSDGDFVPAVKAIKERGIKVENIGFEINSDLLFQITRVSVFEFIFHR